MKQTVYTASPESQQIHVWSLEADGKLTLVNHLGIDLGETPEQILSKLDDDRIKDDDVRHDGRHAHDYDYVHRVRDIEADTPVRHIA